MYDFIGIYYELLKQIFKHNLNYASDYNINMHFVYKLRKRLLVRVSHRTKLYEIIISNTEINLYHHDSPIPYNSYPVNFQVGIKNKINTCEENIDIIKHIISLIHR